MQNPEFLVEPRRISTLADLERFVEEAREAAEAVPQDVSGFVGPNSTGEGVHLSHARKVALVIHRLTDGSAVIDVTIENA